jgi:hypothetical protein
LLLTVLFEVDFLVDFEENIQELRLKGYENMFNNAIKELDEVIKLRSKVETLLEMTTIYVIEDEVIANVSIALAELYNFQLQPFLQLRELAYDEMTKAKQILNNSDLGQRVKKEAEKELKEFREQYLSSTEALQQLYQEYYRKTVELVSGQTERMRCDQNKFGQSAFQVKGALTRLQKLELFLSQEKLKLLNSIKVTKEFQRDQVQQQLNESSTKRDLQRIESEIYEVQISVLDSKLDIIFEEENLIKQKIAIFQTNMQNEDNINQFFDAVEDVKDLESLNLSSENNSSNECNKLAALKTKLNNLYRKRALIRNKRKSLLLENKSRQTKTTNDKVNYEKHHKVHIRRSFKLAEDKKTRESLSEIRKKTLQRLKNYKLNSLLKNNGKNAFENNESDDNEDKLALPPYPQSYCDQFEDQQKEFPLPPPELTNESQFNTSIQPSSSNCIPPPPFPPPPLPPPLSMPPPPPPPPPPPTSVFQSSKLDLKMAKKDANQHSLNRESVSKKGFPGLIDLNEILKMKGKLRPTQLKDPTNDKKEDQNSLLHATLNRIRTIVEDSDASEGDNSSDGFE